MLNIKGFINNTLKSTGYTIKRVYNQDSNIDDLSRILQNSKKNKIIKLHFGCGPRVLKDWFNIDLNYIHYEKYLQYYTDKHYPESIRGTKEDFYAINFLKDGIPLPDNSVDVIFHEDFFEHLTQKEQIIFLAETLRVLKKNAVHRINTPNLFASMRDNSDFTKGRSGVFIGEWDYWSHYSVMTPPILEDMAKLVGYESIYFNSKNNSIIANELPLEYRPDEKDRPAADSNVFADLIK